MLVLCSAVPGRSIPRKSRCFDDDCLSREREYCIASARSMIAILPYHVLRCGLCCMSPASCSIWRLPLHCSGGRSDFLLRNRPRPPRTLNSPAYSSYLLQITACSLRGDFRQRFREVDNFRLAHHRFHDTHALDTGSNLRKATRQPPLLDLLSDLSGYFNWSAHRSCTPSGKLAYWLRHDATVFPQRCSFGNGLPTRPGAKDALRCAADSGRLQSKDHLANSIALFRAPRSLARPARKGFGICIRDGNGRVQSQRVGAGTDGFEKPERTDCLLQAGRRPCHGST